MHPNNRKLKAVSVIAVTGAALVLAGALADEKALRMTGCFLSLICNAIFLVMLRKMK